MKFPKVQNFQCCSCQNCLILDSATEHPLSSQTLVGVWKLQVIQTAFLHTHPWCFQRTSMWFRIWTTSRHSSHLQSKCQEKQQGLLSPWCPVVSARLSQISAPARGDSHLLPFDAPSPLTRHKWAACRVPLLMPSFPPRKIIPDFLIGQ